MQLQHITVVVVCLVILLWLTAAWRD